MVCGSPAAVSALRNAQLGTKWIALKGEKIRAPFRVCRRRRHGTDRVLAPVEHVNREVEQRRARARSDEVRAVLRSLHEQLARSLVDRGVPPQEAKRILEQVQRDLNRRRAKARFGPGHQQAVGALIAEALMARGISEAEAKKILEDMHRDLTRRMLHGHLEDAERPADSQEVEPDGQRH